MKILGIHHLELTVTNLERSREFYENLPGFKLVANYADFVMLYNGHLYLGLTTHHGHAKDRFDESRTGLDHVAFEVNSLKDLEEASKLYNSQIQSLSNGTQIVVFRDPDNIQLELAYKVK